MTGLAISSKRIGLLLMLAGPLAGIAYGFAVAGFGMISLEVTAVSIALIFAALITWIGYTMFTEPASARPSQSQVNREDLAPETINPRRLNSTRFSAVTDCNIGEGTVVRDQVNLYRCQIGKDCKIESFVYIEEGVVIGDRCKIKPNVFIPTGVKIEDDVFIGPNATFTNDKYPRTAGEWKILETRVGRGSSIGAHSVILPGVRIGERVIVGAGSVVTKDIPDDSVAFGNPARLMARSAVPKVPAK
jgi:UDP-2-acetamido-3-amino-2,3-dideoxy-glucuronate N-acetyltransferase